MNERKEVETVDLSEVSKPQLEILTNFLNLLVQNFLLMNERQEDSREAVDRAIKQEYQDETGGGLNGRSLPGSVVNSETAQIQEAMEGTDEFSDLYVPQLLSLNRAWVNNVENMCFPLNNDWVDIKRKHSLYFTQRGLKDFLPQANKAWTDILKVENQRFKFKHKYSTVIAETIRYGNSGLLHYYNPVEGYVDVKIPGIRNIAIYPESSQWEQSSKILRYDVTYGELLNRSDFNQEFVKAFKPSTESFTNIYSQDYSRGSAEKQRLEEYFVPYGKLRLYDIHVPSVYIEDPEDPENPFIGEDLYFTIAYNPELKPGIIGEEINEGLQTFILKTTKNVDEIEHGIRLSIAGTTLPGEFFHQGMLIPFLPHQYLANQMISGAGRISALLSDPPLSVVRAPDADMEATPPKHLVGGGQYEGFTVTAIIPPEYFQVVNQFRVMMEYLNSEVERGSGLSKGQLAQSNTGRRAAAEIKEVGSAGQLNVARVSGRIDDQILKPSFFCRISKTQRILVSQIEEELEELGGEDPNFDEATAMEEILLANGLFLRLLEFSGIDEAYEEFYKTRLEELFEDQQTEKEIEAMFEEVQKLQEFGQSEVPPYIAPPVTINPETGEETPTMEQVMADQEAYLQAQKQERQQALEQVSMIQGNIDMKKFQLKNVKEIPEPSFMIYYEILTESIRDSDLFALGTQSTLSKDLARQQIANLIDLVKALPENVQRTINFDGLLDKIALATADMSSSEIRRDMSDIKKEEEQMQQTAQMENEIRLKMLNNPGAQPPKMEK